MLRVGVEGHVSQEAFKAKETEKCKIPQNRERSELLSRVKEDDDSFWESKRVYGEEGYRGS